MPSLRSSIRRRLEEAEQQQDSVEQDPIEQNPVEAEELDNPVEAAAAEAVAKKLDEQPDPVLAQQPRYEEEDDDENDDAVEELELKAAHASAQVQGHKFGSRAYVDALEAKLRPNQEPRRERGSPSVMAPVSRESPSWSSGRTTPSRTELTGEEVALANQLLQREQETDACDESGWSHSGMTDDDNPYLVLGPGQILLSPTAREWAAQFGMTETEMARHLVEQDRLRRAGQIQRDGES